jgi:hypothetical protein
MVVDLKETKNLKLLKLWGEYEKLPFPPTNTKSKKISDIITDLGLADSYIAGYINTYIFHGGYTDERKDFDLRDGIKSQVDYFKKLLSKLKKVKCPKEDSEKFKAIVNYIKETIRIAELVLKEKR